MMKKIEVLYVTNVPSPYRVVFFNKLSTECFLTVLYERRRAKDRNSKWVGDSNNNYKTVFLRGRYFLNDFAISFEIKHYLKNLVFDFVVFCDYSSPTGIIGINYCIRHKIRYFIEGDGAFYKKTHKDYIKKRLLSYSSLCLSTCSNLDFYYLKLNVNTNNIVRYRFSSLTKDDLANNSKLLKNVKSLKTQLGIGYSKVILFVGQFIQRKGIDLLLKAITNIREDFCLLVVGGLPSKKMSYFMEKQNNKNVFFYNFMTKEELDSFYRISDYFVLPTREDIWGLVVNEALSYGLPVLTTDRCNAGLELIKEGYNGYIVKHDSVEALAEGLKKMLSNKKSLRNNCLESIKEYTIENMVRDHMDIFSKYGK